MPDDDLNRQLTGTDAPCRSRLRSCNARKEPPASTSGNETIVTSCPVSDCKILRDSAGRSLTLAARIGGATVRRTYVAYREAA
jgi:hypothetical protein